MNKVMFQSNSDEWATPKKLFEELDREFKFTLDPCATPDNAKCKGYSVIRIGNKADMRGNDNG